MILLIPALLYVYKIKSGGKEEVPHIFEIKNTQLIYSPPESNTVTIEKHYMIIAPPKDLDELEAVVEKFEKENPIDNKLGVQENKKRIYEVYFYRESKRLPRTWKPNGGYFTTAKYKKIALILFFNIILSSFLYHLWCFPLLATRDSFI